MNAERELEIERLLSFLRTMPEIESKARAEMKALVIKDFHRWDIKKHDHYIEFWGAVESHMKAIAKADKLAEVAVAKAARTQPAAEARE